MADDRVVEMIGEVRDDGVIVPDFLSIIKRIIPSAWFKEGTKLEISLKIYRKNRSNAQNRFYYGAIIPTIKAWRLETEGVKYDTPQIHAYNLMEVWGQKPVFEEVMGKQVVYFTMKGTSTMTTVEFETFMDILRQYYAERDCILPYPNENNFTIDIYEKQRQESLR